MGSMSLYGNPTLEVVVQRAEMISFFAGSAAAICIAIFLVLFIRNPRLDFVGDADKFVRNDDLPGYWRHFHVTYLRFAALYAPAITAMMMSYAPKMIVPNNPGMLWGAVSMVVMMAVALSITFYAIFRSATDLAAGFEACKHKRSVQSIIKHFEKRRAKLTADTALNAQGASN